MLKELFDMEDTVSRAAMPDPATAAITPAQKKEWNTFLDFINSKGLRGSKDLDKKDTNIGRSLMAEYIKANPETSLSYDIVKPMQKSVIDDWALMEKIKGVSGVRTVNADDRKISPPDGWLGSQTSNGYFPTATTTNQDGAVVKDWGHDLSGYYKSLVGKQVDSVPVYNK